MQVQHKVATECVSESVRKAPASLTHWAKDDSNPFKIFTNPGKNLPRLQP